MNVVTTKPKEGFTFQHFIDRDKNALMELKRQYEAQAKRAWLDKLSGCDPRYLLVVETIVI